MLEVRRRYIFAGITLFVLIPIEEALKRVDQHTVPGEIISIPVDEAMGFTLVNDITSPINMPPFQQSAMDGYAICFHGSTEFIITGEIKAGDSAEPVLKKGEAVRIFTGAPVPTSAEAVIRQEDTEVENSTLKVHPLPKLKANIRPLGEQIKAGEIALEKGHVLNAASLGYLSTLGISQVQVYSKPNVAILVTGNELITPGTELKYGQIYESNAPMLVGALKNQGIDNVQVYNVRDDYQSTLAQLKDILDNHDLVLCSGGISVGDYDFVGKVLRELGVAEVFYKVKQKPGKPLFFGKKEEKLVFALPGNPAAALSCFYVYVVKALNIITGKRQEGLPRTKKKITADFTRKGDRAQFLKASVCEDEVHVLEGQSSAMLHTFALANALVYVPAEVSGYKKGDEVECIILAP